MVSGYHHDRRVGQSHAQPLQLLEAEQDRGIRGPDGVEDVARYDDQVRTLDEQVVHRPAERLGDVGLALIPPSRRLPVVLAEAEVQVGEVRELHRVTWPRSAGATFAASWPSSSRVDPRSRSSS